jgi:Tol biopolymer transport system component
MKKKYLSMLLSLFVSQPAIAQPGWKISSEPVKFIGNTGEAWLHPVWSPDGKWIAFTSQRYQGIRIKHLETGEVKRISDDRAGGFGFRWSNSGEAIVARTARFVGRKRLNEVKIFSIKDGSVRVVSGSKTRFRGLPRWSDDDQFVYIMGKRKINVFESGIRKMAKSAGHENRQMFYLKAGKIMFQQGASGKGRTFGAIKDKRCLNLVVSPDRSKLAFEVIGDGMYVMSTDGTNAVKLGKGFRPQWSPDGEYLVYMITEDDGHRFTGSDIYAIKVDGSEKTQLTNTDGIPEMNPHWSPDGQQLAFDTYREGAIYIVNIEK